MALEAGKDKENGSLLENLEGVQPCWHLSVRTSDSKIVRY